MICFNVEIKTNLSISLGHKKGNRLHCFWGSDAEKSDKNVKEMCQRCEKYVAK